MAEWLDNCPRAKFAALLCSALLCRRGIVVLKGIVALLINISLHTFGGWTGSLCQLCNKLRHTNSGRTQPTRRPSKRKATAAPASPHETIRAHPGRSHTLWHTRPNRPAEAPRPRICARCAHLRTSPPSKRVWGSAPPPALLNWIKGQPSGWVPLKICSVGRGTSPRVEGRRAARWLTLPDPQAGFFRRLFCRRRVVGRWRWRCRWWGWRQRRPVFVMRWVRRCLLTSRSLLPPAASCYGV